MACFTWILYVHNIVWLIYCRHPKITENIVSRVCEKNWGTKKQLQAYFCVVWCLSIFSIELVPIVNQIFISAVSCFRVLYLSWRWNFSSCHGIMWCITSLSCWLHLLYWLLQVIWTKDSSHFLLWYKILLSGLQLKSHHILSVSYQ